MLYFLRLPKALYLGFIVFTLSSCSSSSDTTNKDTQISNSIPIANAGIDQLTPFNTTVLLDGSNSSDQDNDPLSYRWEFLDTPLNSQATIINANSFNPTFLPDLSGDYEISLVVNDQVIDSAADTVLISVTEANIIPVANAGPDQSVSTNSLVSLDGSGSVDSNQDQLTFLWDITSRPQGSNVTLSSSNGSTTTFSPDEDGTYLVSLVVNDGIAQSILDEVVIVSTTGNSAPTANAGPDQNILTGENTILDGRASSDPDLDTLTYEWTLIDQPSGSSSVIIDSGSAIANISTDIDGIYELQLTVSDGQLERSDSIEITSTSLNVAPIANAGPDQSVSTNSLVTLDGSGSRDDDNDTLSFEWQFLSVPTNSAAVLNSTSTISPTFTSDIDGTYVLQLRVSDGTTNSEVDSISVISTTNSSSLIDQFDGTQPLLTTVNNANSLPDITKNTGRYLANLTNNSNDITLHFNQYQGRLDAALVSFPFEFIARNVGIGRQDNSQLAPPDSGSPFLFAGVQVHDFDLNSVNSSHVVVGHRGDTGFTIEGKNTVNGNSSVNDNGENSAPLGRADIRVVGNSDRSLTVYWQTPNLAHLTQQDTWILYGPTWMTQPDGRLPGTTPTYGNSVYVGLITYAFSNTGVPFVGTCDSIEIK
jgi:hypothetical protein